MRYLRVLMLRIAGLFRIRRAEEDMRDEFALHIEMQTAENVRRGMTADEAHRQAMIAAGNLTAATERVREQRSLPFVETLLSDVRYGARGLRRNPTFTLIAVTTLALGIGANTAIFSVVSAVILRPLSYGDPATVVAVISTRDGQPMAVSPRDFADWRTVARKLSGLSAGTTSSTVLTGSGDPTTLSQARISANTFDVLGLKPVIGRTFKPGEDETSAPRVGVLSEGLWRRRFGADTAIVGQSILLDGFPTTVVGVAPASMQWPEPPTYG